jgi:iron-sulfur cluster assembly 1
MQKCMNLYLPLISSVRPSLLPSGMVSTRREVPRNRLSLLLFGGFHSNLHTSRLLFENGGGQYSRANGPRIISSLVPTKRSITTTTIPTSTTLKTTSYKVSRAPLTLTENAIKRLKEIQREHPEALGVRVCVKTRGCSGHSYALEWATEKRTLDEEVTQNDVRVFIDSKALMSIIGTQMDYIEEPLRSEFIFRNPNVKGTCGCGESFYL